MSKRGGHHGGAWKVAYADFVTAMMALFLVLWLTSQDEKIKEAVERAFTNPFASVTKESVGIIPNDDVQAVKSSDGPESNASAIELEMLRRLNEDLLKSIEDLEPEDENSPVKLDLIPDGLRISIFDRARKPVFESNSKEFTTYGAWVVSTIAWEIARFSSFMVELEGHTESGTQFPDESYGEWELTSDRANAARRLLIGNGVDTAQIQKIAGFGDTRPFVPGRPYDENNRRVEIYLRVDKHE